MDATNVEDILSGYGFTYDEEWDSYYDGKSFGDTCVSVEIEDGKIRTIGMYFIE